MAASVDEQQQKSPLDEVISSKPEEDEELEDGELDTDDDDDVNEAESTAAKTSETNKSTTHTVNQSPSHKSTSGADSENQNSKRRRSSSFSKSEKSKRSRSDSESDSSEEDSKLDTKTMMQMFKQMQEMFKSTSEHKLSHRKRNEMNKMFEKMKKCNYNQKEMARMFRKNRKMIKFDLHDSRSDDHFGRLSPDRTTIQSSNGASFASSWSEDAKSLYSKRGKGKQHEDRKLVDVPVTKDGIPRQQQLCKFFLEGHCNRGNDCAFIHQQPNHVALKREVCKFYLQDSCGKGDNCTFLHKEFPCKFFHTGVECIAGENCRFSHEPMDEEMREIFNNYIGNNELNEELNQGYSFFGAGSSVSRPAILGDPPDEVKHSYRTWVWQQEMKKLEEAYQGTKRNLFCVPNQFVIKEQPEYDSEFDEEFFGSSADIGDEENHVLPEPSFYIDTMGAGDVQSTKVKESTPEDDEEELRKLCANDLDLRTMDIKDLANTPFGLEFGDSDEEEVDNGAKTNDDPTESGAVEEEIKSNSALKSWLKEASDDDDDEDDKDEHKKSDSSKTLDLTPESLSNSSSKPNIDISRMLDAIRQSTVKTTGAQSEPPERHNDFWRNILNGFPVTTQNPVASVLNTPPVPSTISTFGSPVISAAPSGLSPVATSRDPRDPRLKRQRNPIVNPASASPLISTSSALDSFSASHTINPLQRYNTPHHLSGQTPPYDNRIHTDEPYQLSDGDITFRLYKVDIDKIDYSKYASLFYTDSRMKNDPRLQKFFSNDKQTTTIKSVQNESKSSTITGLPQFPALTLSNKPKIESIVPPPLPPMSAYELMSSNTSTHTTSSSSILNLDFGVSKKDSIIPQGLSGLANLVTEKSKRNSPLSDNTDSKSALDTNSLPSYAKIDQIESPETNSKQDDADIVTTTITTTSTTTNDDDDDDDPDSPQNRLTIMDEEPSSPRLVIESDV